ncbi:MAG: acetylglutamate kinase [Sporolactobacillus sp.]
MTGYLVIKCGGSVIEQLSASFFENIRRIQNEGRYFPVIVHGGGPAISDLLKKLDIENVFHDGLRVTTAEVLDVAEMQLSGTVNKKLVSSLQVSGAKAVGISGIDGGLFTAEAIDLSTLGYVGTIAAVNPAVIELFCHAGYIPVVSPISADADGNHLNINADQAAAGLAAALHAKLCFISDVPGVLVDQSGQMKCFEKLSSLEIKQLIAARKIHGGMIPKVTAAVECLKQHVSEVVILSGTTPDGLLHYAEGRSVGTKIFIEEETCHAQSVI